MTWFKSDDAFPQHPKVLAIPRRQRPAAVGLWALAGMWCAGQLTDGFVPDYMLEEFGATKKNAQLLATVGLWHAVEGGYQFHDWADWQPTKAQVEAEREAAKERMRRARSGRVRPNNPEPTPNEQGTSGEVRLTPSRPVPSRCSSNEEQEEPLSGKPDPMEGFADFWKRYPRKDAKQDAVKAWKQATKTVDPTVIIEAVQRWPFDSRRNFVPLPASWLRGHRWEDEQVTLPFAAGGRLSADELNNVLGPDHWSPPSAPAGLDPDERWEWERRQRVEHIEDRQQQARTRLGRTA